jgi:hypothetical protein
MFTVVVHQGANIMHHNEIMVFTVQWPGEEEDEFRDDEE